MKHRRPRRSPIKIEISKERASDYEEALKLLADGNLPPAKQRDLARLLNKSTKAGRGRPETIPVMRAPLTLTIDDAIEGYRKQGLSERNARERAFADALVELNGENAVGTPLAAGDPKRSLSKDTIKRYYREGAEELREGEVRLAKSIDIYAEKHGLDAALSDPRFDTGGITRRRYERGKRATRQSKKAEN
jgi:hypothetical protein